jgi:hypothetical protein
MSWLRDEVETGKERDTDKIKDNEDILYNLRITEYAELDSENDYNSVRRVPGGWIFIDCGGYSSHAVFVPFQERRK